ncbi:MAG TPA: HAD-IA family hydrolase [Burkholderiales bacterium]|nr:HAD-IA family hydrolase [Burkholderiales bacterium]
MLRLVAFDLDATLVDFLRVKRLSSDAAALAMVDAGLPLDAAAATERLWQTYREHGLDGDVAFERFLASVDSLKPAILHAGLRAYLHAKDGALAPYPRTVPTLLSLVRRGLSLAIVTDAPSAKAHHRLAATGLAPFFDEVVTADDTPAGKADERPFRLLLSRLGVEAKESLMVGDHPLRDVRSARRAGFATALAAYGTQGPVPIDEDAAPDFSLRRIDDLLGVVDRLMGDSAGAGRANNPTRSVPETR